MFNRKKLVDQYTLDEISQVKESLKEWSNYLVGVQKEFRELDLSYKLLHKLINKPAEDIEEKELEVISHALNYRKEMLIKRNKMERDCLKAIDTTERLRNQYEKD